MPFPATAVLLGVMKNKEENANAVKRASLAGGRAKILEGLFEILDTHVSMDLKVGSPEFERMLPLLAKLEAEQEKAEEERDFFWSIA